MKSAWQLMKRLHRDDRGAEGLEKLLIIAAIVLPLLGALIWFRNDIGNWAKSLWDSVKGDAQQPVLP